MKKKLLRGLLSLAITAAVLAACWVFIISPLYRTEETGKSEDPGILRYHGDTGSVIIENEALLFELDRETTHFTVTEKGSGRVWRSNPENASSDNIALSAYKEVLQSTLLVNYTNASGSVDMNNYAYSIMNGNYSIEVLDDNTVEVVYAVGKIGKIYQIPYAITKEDYNALVSRMSSSVKAKISSYYSLLDSSQLEKKSNREELIAKYPSVTDTALYILKSDTKESAKPKIEGYFADAGYTEEDYARDCALVADGEGNGLVTGALFNVTVRYKLEGNDLLVELPYREVKYLEDYKITSIGILPMFGAASMDEDGYILIPEGGGAVINYNNGKTSENQYVANVYGWDYSTERKEAVSETYCAFPMFAMTGNGGAFMCLMEGPDSFASVAADISGRFTSYNTAYARYTVLHAAAFDLGGKSTVPVYVYEDELPDETIVQRYRFVDSDKYSDLALAYREYLTKRYPALAAGEQSGNMPVCIEVTGAFDKTVVKHGLPVNDTIAATTFAQAEGVVSEISEYAGNNLHVIMSGWANGGIRQKVLTRVNPVSALGGEAGLNSLIASARSAGAKLYMDCITCFAYDSGILDGFSASEDGARFTTGESAKIYDYSVVTFQQDTKDEPYYLVKPAYAAKAAQTVTGYLSSHEASGIAFRDIGSLLSADMNKDDTVTREEVKDMNVSAMEQAEEAGLKISVRRGNEYSIAYASVIVDMDLTGHEYGIIDRQIPFYQMALHGLVDYTGSSVNLSGNYKREILKCAEYGAGLKYTVMAADYSAISGSDYSDLFAANYSAWKDDIEAQVTRFETEMRGLNNISMIGHRVSGSVTVTEYADGTRVYVNYGETDALVDGVMIPACDYSVKRG